MRSAEAGLEESWPDRLIRSRCSERVRLGLRNLYILPSGFGWLWLAACAVLYLMGTGAASSGTLLLCYAGLGLFLLSPFLTQFNLQGLELSCDAPRPGFAGGPLLYPLAARSDVPRLQLRAGFRRQRACWSGDLPAGRSSLAVPWTPARRGLQRPGRLRLESQAPLGLFVCWSLWEPAVPQLIYPQPRRGGADRIAAAPTRHSDAQAVREQSGGTASWFDLTPHRPEEGVQRLAWKQLARSGIRLSKQFSDPQPRAALLRPDPLVPWEQALQQLCERCLRLAAAGAAFGLELEGRRIAPASGERQLHRCLEALALAPRQ